MLREPLATAVDLAFGITRPVRQLSSVGRLLPEVRAASSSKTNAAQSLLGTSRPAHTPSPYLTYCC